MDEQARMKILEMIDKGTITASEGLRLLQALSQDSEQAPSQSSGQAPSQSSGQAPEEEVPAEAEIAPGEAAEMEPVGQPVLASVPLPDSVPAQESEPSLPPEPAPSPELEPLSRSEAVSSPEVESLPLSEPFSPSQVESPPPSEPLPGSPEPTPQADSTSPGAQASTSSPGENQAPGQEIPKPDSPRFPQDVEKWRTWWMIPMWVGVGITVLAAVLMAWTVTANPQNPYGFWFFCLWIPLLLGVAVIALSYSSRKSRWLHVRIDRKPGEKPQHIAISMPLPLRLASWFLRTFGNRIPEIRDKHVGEMLAAVDANTSPENPLYVEVEDEKDGEKVKVYIG